MRKFWIENVHGRLWDLAPKNAYDHRGSFMDKPTGLGIKTKIKSFEIENTFFIEDIEVSAQTIGGALYFSDYKHFDAFVRFIGNVNTKQPLKFFYSTGTATHANQLDRQWYKLVLINDLDKTEIDKKTGFLKCNVKFACLSRWKKDKDIVIELSRHGDPLVYPFTYPYYYGSSSNLMVEIDNEGNLPTACVIKIDAVTDTPYIRLIQNNQIVWQARYHLIVRAGHQLILDSSADKQEATLLNLTDGTRESVYYTGEKDYAFQNFVMIPTGKSQLLINAANLEFGQVRVEYSMQKELI